MSSIRIECSEMEPSHSPTSPPSRSHPRSHSPMNHTGSDEAVSPSHPTSSPQQRYIVTLELSPRILATFPQTYRLDPDDVEIEGQPGARTDSVSVSEGQARAQDNSEDEVHEQYIQSLLPEYLRGDGSGFVDSESAQQALLPSSSLDVFVEGVIVGDEDDDAFTRQPEQELGQSITGGEFRFGLDTAMDMGFDWEEFLLPLSPLPPPPAPAPPSASLFPTPHLPVPPPALLNNQFHSTSSSSYEFVVPSFQIPVQNPQPIWMVIVDAEGTSHPEPQNQEQAVLPIQNVRYHGPPPPPPPVALSGLDVRSELSHIEAQAQTWSSAPLFLTLFNNGAWAWYLRQVTHRPGDRVCLSGVDDGGVRVHVSGRVIRVGFKNGVEWTEWMEELGVTYRCAPGEVQGMGRWRECETWI